MGTLRFSPMVLVQPAVLVDDGDDLTMGPPLDAQSVPLSTLKGSPLYDSLLAQLPELQAAWDTKEQFDVPEQPAPH